MRTLWVWLAMIAFLGCVLPGTEAVALPCWRYTGDDLSDDILDTLEDVYLTQWFIDSGHDTLAKWLLNAGYKELTGARDELPTGDAREDIFKAYREIGHGDVRSARRAVRCARKELKKLGMYMDVTRADEKLSQAYDHINEEDASGARPLLMEALQALRIDAVEGPLDKAEKLLEEAKEARLRGDEATALDKLSESQGPLGLAYRRSRLLQADFMLRYAQLKADRGRYWLAYVPVWRAKRKLGKAERLSPQAERDSIAALRAELDNILLAIKRRDPAAKERLDKAYASIEEMLHKKGRYIK